MQKMNVIAKILVVILTQCRYTKTSQRKFKYNDIQYSSLTLDNKLNSLIYRTLFCVNIYGSYKLLKTVRFFAYPVLGKHFVCQNYGQELFETKT